MRQTTLWTLMDHSFPSLTNNIDADHKSWQCHVSQMFVTKCKLQMNLWALGSWQWTVSSFNKHRVIISRAVYPVLWTNFTSFRRTWTVSSCGQVELPLEHQSGAFPHPFITSCIFRILDFLISNTVRDFLIYDSEFSNSCICEWAHESSIWPPMMLCDSFHLFVVPT